uniref:Transthyretin-like family protein n=1 Tax=Ditylenchus dipsaci TaxID=166011 RepID=A0A915D712_9BILA
MNLFALAFLVAHCFWSGNCQAKERIPILYELIVTGDLQCYDGQYMQGNRVELYDEDTVYDSLMGKSATDYAGRFKVEGSAVENLIAGPIDPYLYITHHCESRVFGQRIKNFERSGPTLRGNIACRFGCGFGRRQPRCSSPEYIRKCGKKKGPNDNKKDGLAESGNLNEKDSQKNRSDGKG